MTAPFIPTDFNVMTLDDVKKLLPSLPDAEKNRHFIEGDHFNNGDDWVGPGPRPGHAQRRDFLDILATAFVSKNVIEELADRLASAVLGREPRWAWAPRRKVTKDKPITTAEEDAIDELESALTDWWDVREVHKLLKRMIKLMLWAKQATWRLYVPAGLTDAAGSVGTVSTIADALEKIFVDIPDPVTSTVWEHPLTKARLGLVLYKDVENKDSAEITFLKGDQTTVKILPAPAAGAEATNDFRKNITMFCVTLDDVFITEQMRSLQRMLNMTLTLLGKGLVDNHFLERIFKDILPPGHWEYEADGVTRKAFIPDQEGRHTGSRTDSYMQSIDYKDELGKTVLASGDVVIRDPLDPTGTIKGIEYWYQSLLEEARQDHILINQSATPSGKSRDEARGDFADSGKDPEMQATLAGRALLLTVVAMAEAFLGSPGKWTDKFKPIFQPRAKYGQLSIEERKQAVEEAEKGFRADETAMAEIGINDVDAEVALIMKSARGQLRLSSEQADVVAKWIADFPREVALQLAGFSEDDIKKIMKAVSMSELDPQNPPVDPNAPQNGGPPKPGGATPPKPVAPGGQQPQTARRRPAPAQA